MGMHVHMHSRSWACMCICSRGRSRVGARGGRARAAVRARSLSWHGVRRRSSTVARLARRRAQPQPQPPAQLSRVQPVVVQHVQGRRHRLCRADADCGVSAAQSARGCIEGGRELLRQPAIEHHRLRVDAAAPAHQGRARVRCRQSRRADSERREAAAQLARGGDRGGRELLCQPAIEQHRLRVEATAPAHERRARVLL
eukprot:7384712-Prymnesium_polylepis.2